MIVLLSLIGFLAFAKPADTKMPRKPAGAQTGQFACLDLPSATEGTKAMGDYINSVCDVRLPLAMKGGVGVSMVCCTNL